MKNHVILIIIFFSVLLFANPSRVAAHAGGGPPFLKINGEYAKTNPYFQGTTTINIPQDNAPDTYLVGKPINFVIEVDVLLKQTTIPPADKEKISFRWSFTHGENFESGDKKYLYGEHITRTFTESRSYLLTLEAKSPVDKDYMVIDTVQIDILPSQSYQRPAISLFVGAEKTKVLFLSQATFDQSVKFPKYVWDFSDGQLYPEMSITKDFSNLDTYAIGMIFNRVIDDKGFIADVGFSVYKSQDTLKFSPFSGMKEIPVNYVTYDQAVGFTEQSKKKNSVLPYVIIVLVVGGVGMFFLVKANKR